MNDLAPHLRTLFEFFPSGVNDKMRASYLERLTDAGISPEILRLAVDRIINTREMSSCPKFAVILSACREVTTTSSSAGGTWKPRTVSMPEARDLAVRRLKCQELDTDEANIQAELARMEMLEVVKIQRLQVVK
jgi:hypothetical protein